MDRRRKLTKDGAAEIKTLLAGAGGDGASQQEIAARCGVSRSLVSDIATGRAHTDVPWPGGNRRRKREYRLGVVLSDVHIPFQDKTACDLALKFIRRVRPDAVHLLGDICDFWSVSRFDKDPLRRLTLQEELDDTRKFLADVRAAARDAKIIYSEGNHEFRLRRFLGSEAKALADLRSLRLENLLDLDKLSIEYVNQDNPYRVGYLLFTHGQVVRKWSGATARAHLEKYGHCTIVGHSHRLGAFYHRDLCDTYGCWENGCLCDLNPEYVSSPDWHHGWSVVWSYSDYFHVEQVPVVGGRYNYHGQMYGEKAKPSRIKQLIREFF